MPKDLTQAYRAYLSEVEQEGRQTLSVLSMGIVGLSLIHPVLLLLGLPATALAWAALYRESRIGFAKQLLGGQVLRRTLRFDDYDPDFSENFEPGTDEGNLRFKRSKLEHFWRSYEASCRMLERPAMAGYRHIVWMILPLLVLTIGMLVLGPLRELWSWPQLLSLLGVVELPAEGLPGGLDKDYWAGILQVLAWLIGIGAATLGKYVIQEALVSAAWDAVLKLPPDDADTPADGGGTRETIITWHLPGEAARLARQNGNPT